jgi:hypothetical protein
MRTHEQKRTGGIKTIPIFALIVAVIACVPSARAQLPEPQQRSMAKRFRDLFDLTKTIERIESGTVPKRELAILFLVLRNTSEVEIHKMRGAEKNQVYLGPDGKREAVYDANGKLVRDGINDGSYNYFHPSDDPLRHFTFDILPWLMAGQSQRDPTTVEERTRAYAPDVYAGLIRALQAARKTKPLTIPDVNHPGEIEAAAFLLKAIERGKGNEVFALFGRETEVTDNDAIAAIQKLETGLKGVFQSVDSKDLSSAPAPSK